VQRTVLFQESVGAMIIKDALALIFVSLGVLSHYRDCRHVTEGPDLPLELLKMALAHFDRIGANTAGLRSEFKEFGVDFGPAPEITQEYSSDGLAAVPDSCSAPRSSGSRVPIPIEEAIRTKYQAGWSKSRIAREFRLNRRTVIRVCSTLKAAV
jgi:hypothetical protein